MRRMTDGKDNRSLSKLSTFIVQLTEAVHSAAEVNFSAMLENALPHPLDDSRQFVGADMCVGFVQHGIRRTEIMEKFHHPLHVSALLGAGE